MSRYAKGTWLGASYQADYIWQGTSDALPYRLYHLRQASALGKGSKEEQRYKKCRRQQRGQRRQVRRGQLCQCEGKTKASQLTSHEFLVGKQGQRFKEDDILALGCIAFRQNSCLGHNGAGAAYTQRPPVEITSSTTRMRLPFI